MRIKGIFAVASALVLGACSTADRARLDASTTEPAIFQARNFIDVRRMGGYKDEVIAKDRYKVHVRTNTVTSAHRAVSIALARAAELAEENGYPYFQPEKLDVQIKCVYVGMGGPVDSATPVVELSVRALDVLPSGPSMKVFDVAKIRINLKPELMTANSVRAQAEQVALGNRQKCISRSAGFTPDADQSMPWTTHDLLADVMPSA
ncbi:CC0125/CC1285 family lipoprotein [Pyruvatibacter mobilis]|uniref:CC0125/CC1285 family lipoprotein n=1 Tax=Pyruvatibacter mobilis TaxID=1712261 RepID=UPI003BAA65BB